MPDIDILQKGGAVMVILVLLSVYAVSVIFYKIFQFFASGIFSNAFIEPVMNHVKKGELTDAENLLGRAIGPVARIMKVAITCVANRDMTQKSRESEIARVGASEIRNLESHMRGLEMVATTSPLLGLLGTVMGMVTAFAQLGAAGNRVDPAMLAGGIWEALLTTVGGLIVAIPAVAAYYMIDGVIEKVRATMRDVTVQILALEDEYIRNEKEQEKRELIERQSREREEMQKRERQLRELQEAQERAVEEAATQTRSTPQSSGTLRLLNPSYNKF